MEYIVIAELEIDGKKVEHFSRITLRQAFNEHHEFTIRLNHDIMEDSGSFSLSNAQKNIGKSTVIRLQKTALITELAYEFRGIICEVRMEQSGRSNTDLVLVGYSPTIVLENGRNLASFYQSDLQKIVTKLTKPVEQFNCAVEIQTQYKKPVNYICQYRESSFHFLNRLSSEFSEFFYYTGKAVHFGKLDSDAKTIDVAYGEDISSMELALRMSPMVFSNYAYLSKENKVEKYDAPKDVDGLGEYASYVLKESNNVFSESVTSPSRQRIESKSDLENFVKKQKAALAAELEILTGSSHNPEICIGGIIDVKISKPDNNNFIKEDYGKFLVTRIEHFISENGKYYNTFEAVPSNIEVLPVTNIIMPTAEPQIAIVKDNNDPDGMGRVRVQMLWQQGNDMTDWIRVMTPDAGGGKGGAKNRGLVVIPETGDQVLICFRYNDPDRPFVMGSMFHGKSGGGGGGGNKSKSLTVLSGATITLDGDAIAITDAGSNNVKLDGKGNIEINSTATIKLKCGDSSIELKKDGTILIDGKTIDITGTNKVDIVSGQASFKADGKSGDAKMDGINAVVTGTAEGKVTGVKATLTGTQTTVNGTGITDIKGGMIMLND
jgi:type VI secretion system secreted protein VgrG